MAKEKTYVPAPQVSEQLQPRYQAVLSVLSGQTSVSEAARSLGMSRNHFQTLMHRGLHGLLEMLEPQPPGRPPKPKEQVELEERVKRLERENEQLRARVEAVDRLLGVAADFAKGKLRASRELLTKPTATAESSDEPFEPDGARHALLAEVHRLKAAGLELSLASRATGLSPSTLRRWKAREACHLPLVGKRGPRAVERAEPAHVAAAQETIRSMNGCIGAAALARCSGVSRRVAAAVKAEMLTTLENERQAELRRVYIAAGAVRAFDAMYFENSFLLVSADAGVPYRTALELVPEYVGPWVAQTLDEDFSVHGAPLVLRLDRAKQHVTPDVIEVLSRHEVLLMHGPPRHPGFYGQLERMNLEHRAVLGRGEINREEVEDARHAFNEVLPRRTLGWRTAGEAWRGRSRLDVDRLVFRAEVEEVTVKLKEKREAWAWCSGTAERLAIEAALKRRGLLSVERGGWC